MRVVSEPNDLSARDVLARYPGLRDDHLRYLEQWGLVRPTKRRGTLRAYSFSDLAVIRQTSAAIAEGRSFRAIVRQLDAERHGQLAFDFRLDAQPARVLTLRLRLGFAGLLARITSTAGQSNRRWRIGADALSERLRIRFFS